MVAEPPHLQGTRRQRQLLIVEKLLQRRGPLLGRCAAGVQIDQEEIELGVVGQVGHAVEDVGPAVFLREQHGLGSGLEKALANGPVHPQPAGQARPGRAVAQDGIPIHGAACPAVHPRPDGAVLPRVPFGGAAHVVLPAWMGIVKSVLRPTRTDVSRRHRG